MLLDVEFMASSEDGFIYIPGETVEIAHLVADSRYVDTIKNYFDFANLAASYFDDLSNIKVGIGQLREKREQLDNLLWTVRNSLEG